MSRHKSPLIPSLIKKGLASPQVDTGISLFGRTSVEGTEYSLLAAGLVTSSIGEPRDQGRLQQAGRYELMLSDEVDPTEAAKWMGKALVRDYGSRFAVLNMFKAASSNRTTNLAIDKLGQSAKKGLLGFVFLIEQGNLTDAQEERANRVSGELSRLALPGMILMPSVGTELELGMGIPENELIVDPQFTIDPRLAYPLILRRTIEPNARLSLVETA